MTTQLMGKKVLSKTILVFCLGLGLTGLTLRAGQRAKGPGGALGQNKILAQQLVDAAVKMHHQLSGLELSATPPGKQACVTIAATEAKDLGEKCDEDEFTALRTRKPFVEKEADGYDITLPLHDASGILIGTLGMDFKPEPGQQGSKVVAQAQQIASEIEKQIPSKAKLLEAVN